MPLNSPARLSCSFPFRSLAHLAAQRLDIFWDQVGGEGEEDAANSRIRPGVRAAADNDKESSGNE